MGVNNGKLELVMSKPKPCKCGRTISGRVFPHRRDDNCEIFEALENKGFDEQKELSDMRFNAEFNKIFS